MWGWPGVWQQRAALGLQLAAAACTEGTALEATSHSRWPLHPAPAAPTCVQIAVYEAAGPRFAELPSELYDVGLAYIADGVATGRAEQLDRALGALAAAAAAVPPGALGSEADSGLRQLAERRAIDERNQRAVARAVCLLLLGETEAAAHSLGLAPGGEAQCERSLLAFIKVGCWVW